MITLDAAAPDSTACGAAVVEVQTPTRIRNDFAVRDRADQKLDCGSGHQVRERPRQVSPDLGSVRPAERILTSLGYAWSVARRCCGRSVASTLGESGCWFCNPSRCFARPAASVRSIGSPP